MCFMVTYFQLEINCFFIVMHKSYNKSPIYFQVHIEMFVTYELQLNNVAEWWKQLYGESEGKENKGIL